MKTLNLFAAFTLLLISTLLSSCSVVTDIFQAGMGFGIFIVLAVIALIIFLIVKAGGNK
jgi:hypothetical protein